MARWPVRVMEAWTQGANPLVTVSIQNGFTLHAAWKYFEGDLLFQRSCSRTQVLREWGRRGHIYLIRHVNPFGERGCHECDDLRNEQSAVEYALFNAWKRGE